MTVLHGDGFILRPWQKGDEDALVRHANNRKIWRNLTNIFPYPYTRELAEDWINRCVEGRAPVQGFAIEINGEAAGSIGSMTLEDVRAQTRSVGYWLGEAHWGKGLATAVVRLYAGWMLRQEGVHRLQAFVFAWNPASMRVLEKSGFQYEGRLRQNIFKDGEFVDELLFGRLKSDATPDA